MKGDIFKKNNLKSLIEKSSIRDIIRIQGGKSDTGLHGERLKSLQVLRMHIFSWKVELTIILGNTNEVTGR